jgi:hypothetical protein
VTPQVTLFQRGEELGVVCFDRERAEVYFAQHFDAGLQLSQIQGFRFLNPRERSLQLSIFITASLTYAETVCQVSKVCLCSPTQFTLTVHCSIAAGWREAWQGDLRCCRGGRGGN